MMAFSPPDRPNRQQGAVLFVSLIMLILITLLALAAMRMATTNLQMVNNQQFRLEAESAVNFVLDQIINDPEFLANAQGSRKVSFKAVDASTDTKALTVTIPIAPKCLRYRYIKKKELIKPAAPYVDPSDYSCFTGLSSSNVEITGPSMTGNPADDTLCATALFDVQARVNDSATGASALFSEGISMRMEINEATEKCK
jgi:hypothetical protein